MHSTPCHPLSGIYGQGLCLPPRHAGAAQQSAILVQCFHPLAPLFSPVTWTQTEAEHSWLPHAPSPVPSGASSLPAGVHCFPPNHSTRQVPPPFCRQVTEPQNDSFAQGRTVAGLAIPGLADPKALGCFHSAASPLFWKTEHQ